MKAKDLITYSLPYIKPQDTGWQAIEMMIEFKVLHLPLVDEDRYITLVSEDDIYNYGLEDKKFQEVRLEIFRPAVYENHNIFDVFNVLSNTKVSVLPVLGQEETFLGSILVNDLIFKVIEIFGLAQEGAVLILRVKYIDYSITIIGNIIESNNAKIVSFFTLPEDETYQKIIIKVNTPDVLSLLETFERYDYEVESVLFDDQKYKDIYKERWDALMKYLNI